MVKKLDVAGILIYIGMAGAVITMVAVLVFTVVKDIILGA